MQHLAHLNVAKMKFPYEDPRLGDFVDALDSVNASAAASPGFVWRLPEEDDAMATQVFGDDLLLINMSVWESIEHLKSFVSSPAHLEIMGRRGEWFHSQNAAYLVLWCSGALVDNVRSHSDHRGSSGKTRHPSRARFKRTRVQFFHILSAAELECRTGNNLAKSCRYSSSCIL